MTLLPKWHQFNLSVANNIYIMEKYKWLTFVWMNYIKLLVYKDQNVNQDSLDYSTGWALSLDNTKVDLVSMVRKNSYHHENMSV